MCLRVNTQAKTLPKMCARKEACITATMICGTQALSVQFCIARKSISVRQQRVSYPISFTTRAGIFVVRVRVSGEDYGYMMAYTGTPFSRIRGSVMLTTAAVFNALKKDRVIYIRGRIVRSPIAREVRSMILRR